MWMVMVNTCPDVIAAPPPPPPSPGRRVTKPATKPTANATPTSGGPPEEARAERRRGMNMAAVLVVAGQVAVVRCNGVMTDATTTAVMLMVLALTGMVATAAASGADSVRCLMTVGVRCCS